MWKSNPNRITWQARESVRESFQFLVIFAKANPLPPKKVTYEFVIVNSTRNGIGKLNWRKSTQLYLLFNPHIKTLSWTWTFISQKNYTKPSFDQANKKKLHPPPAITFFLQSKNSSLTINKFIDLRIMLPETPADISCCCCCFVSARFVSN